MYTGTEPNGSPAMRDRLLRSLAGEDGEGPGEALLRTSEVALLFQVSRRTVIAWAREGKLPHLTTPGGHRRYRANEVRRLLVASASAPPGEHWRVPGAAG